MADLDINNVPVLQGEISGDQHSFIITIGAELRKLSINRLKTDIMEDDDVILNQLAFFMDINVPVSGKSSSVNVGGNMQMRQLWEESGISVLMDDNGNYCELNKTDCNYTADGEKVTESDGTLKTAFSHGDMMKIIPATYARVQLVPLGGNNFARLWLSLVPIPGGVMIPRIVVGKFKASVVSDKLRSIPGVVPQGDKTLREFYELAQSRSGNHGLANLDYHNYLMFHMMSKYGYRDSQNCRVSDEANAIWGCGLDGTENTSQSGSSSWDRQKTIKTGTTLIYGNSDGKTEVLDSAGGIAHSVNVAGIENPWGQMGELMQGVISVGTSVYVWNNNFMPSSSPTSNTFDNVEHVIITRGTSQLASGVNIISEHDSQGAYMIPNEQISGITYYDAYLYAATGVVWAKGGRSDDGSNCGLMALFCDGDMGWTAKGDRYTSRLAYYGNVNKVSTQRFKDLATV